MAGLLALRPHSVWLYSTLLRVSSHLFHRKETQRRHRIHLCLQRAGRGNKRVRRVWRPARKSMPGEYNVAIQDVASEETIGPFAAQRIP